MTDSLNLLDKTHPASLGASVSCAYIGARRLRRRRPSDTIVLAAPPERNGDTWRQNRSFAIVDALPCACEDGERYLSALFTDGIERLVLDLREKTAHTPFFRTLFGWLVKTEPAVIDEEIPASDVVSRYLGSKQVNDRTDDDKTLILASRRPVPNTKELVHANADGEAPAI